VSDFEIRAPRDDEREAIGALSTVAFNASRPSSFDDELDRDWQPALDRRIVVLDKGTPVATSKRWEMGHWLDGRCVPTAGIGSLVVDGLYRRRGVATAMTRQLLTEAVADGEVLSTLYPMNHGLYSKLGYGLGFHRPTRAFDARVLTTLPRPDSHVDVRASAISDIDAIIGVYDAIARTEHGMLRRDRRFTGRCVDNRPGSSSFSYVSERDGTVTGYASWQRRAGDGFVGYRVPDAQVVAADRDSLLVLWRILAAEVPVAASVSTTIGPGDPLLTLLPERCVRGEGDEWFPMTRILDVPGAFAARGWAARADGLVTLRVADPLLEANNGTWTIRVLDGEAQVEPGGGTRDISVGIGALSSAFSSFTDPIALARMGFLTGDSDQIARLSTWFTGRAPWVRDFF
jgi:predicted acetyltransferase